MTESSAGRRRSRRRRATAPVTTPPPAGEDAPSAAPDVPKPTPPKPEPPRQETTRPRHAKGESYGESLRSDSTDERAMRDIVGSGPSKLGVSKALRGRDVNRPTEADLAEAEADIDIVRRHWKPPE